MKILQKMRRAVAVLMLTLLLFTVSANSSVALGAYTTSALPPSQNAYTEVAAFPAVAYGVVLVAAFAYGVYTGYGQDDKETAGVVALELYQSDDFSQFDGSATAM